MMKLADVSKKDQIAMAYPALCALRRDAYEAHVVGMSIPQDIDEWARKMEFRMANSGLYEEWCQSNEMMPSDAAKAGWCMTCGVWANRVSWAAALMVVRYGEEPSSWPADFSEQDVVRAENWLAGRVPGAVVSANKRGV